VSEEIKFNIETEGEFLAHTIALKLESEERLESLADCLEAHNNPEASKVFRDLADHVSASLKKLEAIAFDYKLPVIPPWEHGWHCATDPEALCIDQAHYLMTGKQALELALFNEQRSLEFLKRVIDQVGNEEVKRLAAGMIKMEQEFTHSIREALDNMGDDVLPCEDLDPPNMPE
jgi:hypothetical protein